MPIRSKRARRKDLAVDTLVRRWNEGVSTKQIAEELGIAPQGVYYYVRLLRTEGLLPTTPQPSPEITEQEKELLELWNHTDTRGKDIAEKLDMPLSSFNTKKAILAARGFEVSSRKYTPHRGGNKSKLTPELESLLGTVMDVDIAREAGVSRERVRQWRFLRGIPKFELNRTVPPEELLGVWNSLEPFLTQNPIGTAAAILAIAGSSFSRQLMKLRMAGWDVDSWPERCFTKFSEAWIEAKSPREASEKLGIDSHQVCSMAARYRNTSSDIKRYRIRWTEEVREAFVEAWNSAETLKDVVKAVEAFYPGAPVTERNMELVAMKFRKEGNKLKKGLPYG